MKVTLKPTDPSPQEKPHASVCFQSRHAHARRDSPLRIYASSHLRNTRHSPTNIRFTCFFLSAETSPVHSFHCLICTLAKEASACSFAAKSTASINQPPSSRRAAFESRIALERDQGTSEWARGIRAFHSMID